MTARLPRPSVSGAFDLVSRVYDLDVVQRVGYRANHDAVLAALAGHGPDRVLDVGCGTGILAARIREELRPALVVGCDASEGMLEKARARTREVRWVQGAAERLPLEDGAVDAAVTTEAFHFFDQPRALRELRRVLEPGGCLVVAVIAPRVPTAAFTRNAPARWPTPRETRRMLEEAGFAVRAQRPVHPRLGLLSPGVATVAIRA